MTIGQRIRGLRILRGYSQQALAKKLGVAQSYVHKIENSDGDMRVRTLIKVADRLSVKPGVLLDAEEYEQIAAQIVPTEPTLCQAPA